MKQWKGEKPISQCSNTLDGKYSSQRQIDVSLTYQSADKWKTSVRDVVW